MAMRILHIISSYGEYRWLTAPPNTLCSLDPPPYWCQAHDALRLLPASDWSWQSHLCRLILWDSLYRLSWIKEPPWDQPKLYQNGAAVLNFSYPVLLPLLFPLQASGWRCGLTVLPGYFSFLAFIIPRHFPQWTIAHLVPSCHLPLGRCKPTQLYVYILSKHLKANTFLDVLLAVIDSQ